MENNKKLTRSDIITTDIVYSVFAIVVAACFLAIAFVSALILIGGVIHLVKSFMLAHIAKAFLFTILMLLSDAVFIYIDIVIFKTMKASILKYLQERKAALKDLD